MPPAASRRTNSARGRIAASRAPADSNGLPGPDRSVTEGLPSGFTDHRRGQAPRLTRAPVRSAPGRTSGNAHRMQAPGSGAAHHRRRCLTPSAEARGRTASAAENPMAPGDRSFDRRAPVSRAPYVQRTWSDAKLRPRGPRSRRRGRSRGEGARPRGMVDGPGPRLRARSDCQRHGGFGLHQLGAARLPGQGRSEREGLAHRCLYLEVHPA